MAFRASINQHGRDAHVFEVSPVQTVKRACMLICSIYVCQAKSIVNFADSVNFSTSQDCRLSAFGVVKGQVVLDQIRTVDKLRLTQKLGSVSKKVQDLTLHTLAEMFER